MDPRRSLETGSAQDVRTTNSLAMRLVASVRLQSQWMKMTRPSSSASGVSKENAGTMDKSRGQPSQDRTNCLRLAPAGDALLLWLWKSCYWLVVLLLAAGQGFCKISSHGRGFWQARRVQFLNAFASTFQSSHGAQ
eukprot:TRINITY_DN18289_c0_g1_i3.p1 TRINITY_DN18289_c0_g1~~TRINITY_DN18289_c0_g1_i3.p1  ORF type:complete len:136 (+),score=21.67 TRINITY_DN18289_c0_g1_i3:244-651(+)